MICDSQKYVCQETVLKEAGICPKQRLSKLTLKRIHFLMLISHYFGQPPCHANTCHVCTPNFPASTLPSPLPDVFYSFFFLLVFLSFFSFNFLTAGVKKCCRSTNRHFCQNPKNFKVCLTYTLGRPTLGARESHAETLGRVLKALCVSTLLTFKGTRTLLSPTQLL